MAYSLTGVVRDPENGKAVVSGVLVQSYRLDTFAAGPTATSANTGVVTLTGLTDGVQYGAYADYNGKHVNVPLMWTPSSLASAAYGTATELADVVSSATGEAAGTSALIARADHRHAIAAGSIVNADVSGSAAIAVSKLADYANTTWTPVLSGDVVTGANTYAAQAGNYIRIGPLVIATFYVGLSAKDGTMAGNIYISLPVASRNTTNYYPVGALRADYVTLTAGNTWMTGIPFPNQSRLFLFQHGTGIVSSTLGPAAIANNTAVLGTIAYLAA